MCDRQHRESLAHCPSAPLRHSARPMPFEPGCNTTSRARNEKNNWRQSLHRLQELICELLIRNQELRMSLLDSAANQQSSEADQ